MGARYNALARRAEEALKDEELRTALTWRDLSDARNRVEHETDYVVSNRMQDCARACVLAKHVDEAPVRRKRYLIPGYSTSELKRSNSKHKKALLARKLENWV
eukprot:TRINITY_DN9080_c0_g1_i1.p1 TRINITY_DN9080_c0_g1~~TRINITY_DN9080_c0_g1_i1.p1  ORF type:complete len:103 (-),score=0.59 TRINITY_DN9080_c0_g1_i1:136-444(-)